MYLLRKGKVEFSGKKKEIIEYLLTAYSDDYWVQEYGKVFNKDYSKLKYAVECLGLSISNRKGK